MPLGALCPSQSGLMNKHIVKPVWIKEEHCLARERNTGNARSLKDLNDSCRTEAQVAHTPEEMSLRDVADFEDKKTNVIEFLSTRDILRGVVLGMTSRLYI